MLTCRLCDLFLSGWRDGQPAVAAQFAETDNLFLQYGFISGYPRFRKSLAGFLTEWYVPLIAACVFA